MSSGDYLTVEPSKLSFLAELGREASCFLQLLNKTDRYVAFNMRTTPAMKYTVHPSLGVVSPRSIGHILVKMRAQMEFPEDMQCNDKFLLQSAITFSKDIDLYVFNKESGYHIKESKLRAVYVSPPQFPLPITEGSKESYSPSTLVSDDGSSNISDSTSIPKVGEKPHKQYAEIWEDITQVDHPFNLLSPEAKHLCKDFLQILGRHTQTLQETNSRTFWKTKPPQLVNWRMSSKDYVTVEPSKLSFTAEVGKELSRSLLLLNNTNRYVAFSVRTTPAIKYSVDPNLGGIWPLSICRISVKMRAQTEFPEDMQCNDKFLLQSAITFAEDVDLSMFNPDSGYHIKERKLVVVYVSPPRPPSPIVKGSNHGSSSRIPITDNGNSNTSNLTLIPKADEEPQKKYSEIMKNPSHKHSKAGSERIENFLRELPTAKPSQFSHADLINFTSNMSTELGSGAFGKVYKGQFVNGVEIAVKVLVENEVVEEEFMAEMSTMGTTYHRNLVKLYGFCFDDNMKALVYEYASNGSLDHVLYEKRFDLKWEKLFDIAVETAKALVYLHDGCHHKIIHPDIKPANVLLDFDFSPKITDFGLAKLMSRNVSHLTMTRIRGTAGYAAPETWMPFSEITYKCDVYSFGMLLFEILGRRKNVTKDSWFPKQVWEKFESGRLDELIVECGITTENKGKARILCMVALWCIQFTPSARPSMNTVSTMLEEEIQVTIPPNPFLSSLSLSSMQPAQYS